MGATRSKGLQTNDFEDVHVVAWRLRAVRVGFSCGSRQSSPSAGTGGRSRLGDTWRFGPYRCGRLVVLPLEGSPARSEEFYR